MPIYQYRCPQGHELERIIKPGTDAPSVVCGFCGNRAERILSTPAPPQFTGSGFYATDYQGRNK